MYSVRLHSTSGKGERLFDTEAEAWKFYSGCLGNDAVYWVRMPRRIDQRPNRGVARGHHDGEGDELLTREFPLLCEMPSEPMHVEFLDLPWSGLTRSRLRHADRFNNNDRFSLSLGGRTWRKGK